MTHIYPAKQQAWDWIETNRSQMSNFHTEIWNYAETAWRERKSARAFVEILRKEGFTVEEGSGEMPIAFAATWGEEGPLLGTDAEYDAVPGNSQQPVPRLAPMRDPFISANQRLTSPQECEDSQQQSFPPWQVDFTSDDYVDYTWHAPTVSLHTARPSLVAQEPEFVYPAWVTNAMGGVPDCIDPGMFLAGKTIAATLLDLFTKPKGLKKAQTSSTSAPQAA